MKTANDWSAIRTTSLAHERALILAWCLRDAMQALKDEIENNDEPAINDGNADLASSMDFQLDMCASFLDSDVRYLAPESMTLLRRLATLLNAAPDSVLGDGWANHNGTAKAFRKAVACV